MLKYQDENAGLVTENTALRNDRIKLREEIEKEKKEKEEAVKDKEQFRKMMSEGLEREKKLKDDYERIRLENKKLLRINLQVNDEKFRPERISGRFLKSEMSTPTKTKAKKLTNNPDKEHDTGYFINEISMSMSE